MSLHPSISFEWPRDSERKSIGGTSFIAPICLSLFTSESEFEEQEWPALRGVQMFLSYSLLRVIKCGKVLYIRLAGEAGGLRLYGFNMLGLFWRQINLALIFSNMHTPLRLSAHAHIKDLTVVAVFAHPCTCTYRCYPPPPRVDSVIYSKLWSPSIRAISRQHQRPCLSS